jgi:hypothetical protein
MLRENVTRGEGKERTKERTAASAGGDAEAEAPLSTECEVIGLAASDDGVKFIPSVHNPLIPTSDATPYTGAMAEGHILVDEAKKLLYVYHTIRWAPDSSGSYPNEDGEDIGVEILSPSPDFVVDGLRVVGATDGGVAVASKATTSCSYCKPPCWKPPPSIQEKTYCPPIKTRIEATGSPIVVTANMGFTVEANCGIGQVSGVVNVYSTNNGRDYPNTATATPTTTHDVSAKCMGDRVRMVVKPIIHMGGIWHRFSFSNTGDYGLTNVTVTAKLVGVGPAPPPAP